MPERRKDEVRGGDGLAKSRMRPRVEYVRIPKYQTASVWMLEGPDASKPRVVSYHCPTCENADNSRLIQINVPTEPWRPLRERIACKTKPAFRMLLHVTRAQIEQILQDFGKQNNAATLEAVFYSKDDSSD